MLEQQRVEVSIVGILEFAAESIGHHQAQARRLGAYSYYIAVAAGAVVVVVVA